MDSLWSSPYCRFVQKKFGTLTLSPRTYIPRVNFSKIQFSSKRLYCSKTTNVENTPKEFREPFIFKGYRHRMGFLDCLYSLFYLHNELFNCWSHIAGIPIVLSYFFEEYRKPYSSPVMYLYLFSCFCFVFGSSFAHTFCSNSSVTRDASFTIDYIGLVIFACGSGLAYSLFSFPLEVHGKHGLFGLSFLNTYMLFLSLCSMVSIYQSVRSRTLPDGKLKLITRTCAFASPGVLMSIPIMYKIITCSLLGQLAYPLRYCDSTAVWPKQFASCIISVMFYITRFPECLYPGRFDYFGHSHNVFHVGALLGLHYQKTALSLDLKFAMEQKFAVNSIQIPLACFFMLFLFIIFTCFHFRRLFSTRTLALFCAPVSGRNANSIPLL